MRDLTDASPAAIAAERARVPREGIGVEILTRQGSDGSWHRADAPAWLPTLYTLLLLRATGVDCAEPAVESVVARLEKGFRWDEETQRCVSVVVRVDDPRVLAQVRPWRGAACREARHESLRRLGRWLSSRPHCEYALRQLVERLTLVYEDGRREVEDVDIHRTPFGDCWQKARGNQLPAVP